MSEISTIIEEICEEMRTKYCKWPNAPRPEGASDEWLYEEGGPCCSCPLNRIN